MFPKFIIGVIACSALGLACSPKAPGANAQDLSAAQHERLTQAELAKAEAHGAQYDPSAKTTEQNCADLLGSPACWTSTTNPTKEHLEHAAEHRKRAADQRAASQALRDAEARACVGIREDDRDDSPFDHREDIASIAELESPWPTGKSATRHPEGAIITFRAVPGMTAGWLQRVVDCHLARNAALGHVVPEMAYCPLVPKGVSANVRSVPGGFSVDVRASDAATAREVWRRAEALSPTVDRGRPRQ